MNEKGLSVLDVMNVLSFYLGIKNLDMNITQTDLQNETKRLDKVVDEKVQFALSEIHKHLQVQDQKLDYIIELLEKKDNENTTTIR
jgi:predicted transcriptional regulator